MISKSFIDFVIAIIVFASCLMCGKTRATVRQDVSVKKSKAKPTTSQPKNSVKSVKKVMKKVEKKEKIKPRRLGNQPTREDEGMETQSDEKKEKLEESSKSTIVRADSEKRSRRSPKKRITAKALAPPQMKKPEEKEYRSPQKEHSSTESSDESEKYEKSDRKKKSEESVEKTMTKTEDEGETCSD